MRKYLLLTALLAIVATAVWAAQPQGGTRVEPLPAPSLERTAMPQPSTQRTRVEPMAPVAPAPVFATLWDQPLTVVDPNAYVDQAFGDVPSASSYQADDFTNPAPWNITGIFVPGSGWNGFTTLMNATNLHWAIWADAAGVPAGNPEGGAAPVWSLTLPPGDAHVAISTGYGGFSSNVQVTLPTPATIPAGHWWFAFWPDMTFAGGGQYGRQGSDTANGYTGQFINPGGYFGLGSAWQAWSVLGATRYDQAFRLDGTLGYDTNFLDDLGRSQACVSRSTGSFVWNILSGPYAGYSVTGTSMARNGGTLFYVSTPGYYFYCSYDPIRKRATGYFYDYSSHIYSSLSDANTTDNPPGCAPLPPG